VHADHDIISTVPCASFAVIEDRVGHLEAMLAATRLDLKEYCAGPNVTELIDTRIKSAMEPVAVVLPQLTQSLMTGIGKQMSDMMEALLQITGRMRNEIDGRINALAEMLDDRVAGVSVALVELAANVDESVALLPALDDRVAGVSVALVELAAYVVSASLLPALPHEPADAHVQPHAAPALSPQSCVDYSRFEGIGDDADESGSEHTMTFDEALDHAFLSGDEDLERIALDALVPDGR